MKNILIINGWHTFAGSKGTFNKSLFKISTSFFNTSDMYTIKTTEIDNGYHIEDEVLKFIWSDIVIYHTPIWWFSIPFNFKKYLDEVLTAGYKNGMWESDGRTAKNPEINYGTGGLLTGKKYILTTSWNAPKGAFILPNEFFNEISVDNGPMSGFHGMNKYLGLQRIASLQFHDIEKNANANQELENYTLFLEHYFSKQKITTN
ncbi:NAD(P)H-dependent oxidoreductase [Aquimarina longa]|uniref:NAD(P)H-dependent oxidoreductase n=1 Tax=Aquimarina longa TaxID=1080221 RepID=UPI0007864B20|nr:NAD(P)H-dependent oxidoreductase [Aquimarina longa]